VGRGGQGGHGDGDSFAQPKIKQLKNNNLFFLSQKSQGTLKEKRGMIRLGRGWC